MTEQQRRGREQVAALVASDPALAKAKRRWEVARRVAWIVTAMTATGAMALMIYLAGSANAGAEAIQDCTTPGGKCYERSQRQSAALVGQIVQAQQQAVATGSQPARDNLALTKANAQRIQVMLAILDEQYPEAAKVARAELGVSP